MRKTARSLQRLLAAINRYYCFVREDFDRTRFVSVSSLQSPRRGVLREAHLYQSVQRTLIHLDQCGHFASGRPVAS